MSYLVIEARVIKSSQENLTWRSDHLHWRDRFERHFSVFSSYFFPIRYYIRQEQILGSSSRRVQGDPDYLSIDILYGVVTVYNLFKFHVSKSGIVSIMLFHWSGDFRGWIAELRRPGCIPELLSPWCLVRVLDCTSIRMFNLESGLSRKLDSSAPQVPVETRCDIHVRIPQDAMKTRSTPLSKSDKDPSYK